MGMGNAKFVSYLRVSTARQGRSGLGLEAQREAVRGYLEGNRGKLLGEYVEVESGKNDARPQLAKAMHHAKVTGATLVVAKLDRLSRNAGFLTALKQSGIELAAADMPKLDTLMFHVMAGVAQHEREAISARTKLALAAAKRRGVKLGNPNGARALRGVGNNAAVASLKAQADGHARDIAPVIEDIRAGGAKTLREIAAELNRREIRTARGGQYHPTTVKNVLERIGEA